MEEIYSPLGRHALWLADNANSIRRQPELLRPLVNDRGSLTSALVALSGDCFEVNLLSQRVSVPFHHEQTKLNRPLHRAAMVREVELLVNRIPVVYARSIVPLSLVTKGKSGLANLGRTPLGHLLFKNGKIRVSKRQFAIIGSGHDLIPARRTPYEYQGSVILVSEFFLPSIYQFLSQG